MDRRGCLSESRQDDRVPGRPAAGDTCYPGCQPDAETADLAAYQRGAGQSVPGCGGSLSVTAHNGRRPGDHGGYSAGGGTGGAGVAALNPRGELYMENNISERLASRNLMEELRATGMLGGGPAPYDNRDKQAFANRLDRWLVQRGLSHQYSS